MKYTQLMLAISLTLLPISVRAQETNTLDLEQAINIALNKSNTVMSYNESKLSAEHYFKHWEAQFKPRLDYRLYAPSWNESVSSIEQADGLPVYNSTGYMTYQSDLTFTVTLPTNGDFSFKSQLYRGNIKTVLAQQDYITLSSRKARSSFSLNFSQPIFTKNQLKLNLEEARLQFEMSSSEFNRRQLDIIYDVTRGFYDVFRGTRNVEIAREKLENAEEAYRIAKLMAEAGRIPEVDVFSGEVDVAQSRAELSSSQGELERYKDVFKQLIGISLYDDIDIATSLQVDTVRIDQDVAIEKALANRRELIESDLNIKLRQVYLDRAKGEREFKGSINAYYDITGVSTQEHGPTSELFRSALDNIDDRPPNRGVTLEFSYPIFDWGRGKQLVQRQEANLRYAELQMEKQHNDIIREVRDIIRSVDEAKNRLEIQEKNQEVAQRNYRIRALLFEHGELTSQELRQAQEQLTKAQLDYLDAYITYQLQLADLKRKTIWDFKSNTSYLQASYFRMEE